MPRKKKSEVKLPKEVQQLVDKVTTKQDKAVENTESKNNSNSKQDYRWDFPKDSMIRFFDPNCSYELTGYKPIDSTRGLDFDIEPFIKARTTFKQTGHYCQAPRNSKAYADFWTNEYKRCRDGITINGYTITGDHYFFLNYYQLANLETARAGDGRLMDFPCFYVAQYIWYHYLELCKILRKNAVLMKARGLGQF